MKQLSLVKNCMDEGGLTTLLFRPIVSCLAFEGLWLRGSQFCAEAAAAGGESSPPPYNMWLLEAVRVNFESLSSVTGYSPHLHSCWVSNLQKL